MPQFAVTTAFALLPTLLGTLSTYLYEDDATPLWRMAAGACTGFAALGLLGFATAFALPIATVPFVVAAAAAALIAALLCISALRHAFRNDIQDLMKRLGRAAADPTFESGLRVLGIGVAFALTLAVVDRVLFVRDDGLHTGVMTNFGDLPFHIGVIARFAEGTNVPPESPIFAGVPFSYPFLADFITALPVASGVDVRQVMYAQNLVLLLAFAVLLHSWSFQLTQDRLAAAISCALVIASGGLGWWMLFGDVAHSGGFVPTLGNLRHDYTIMNRTTWRWGNVVTALLLPQRSFLLGLPIALVVFTLLHREIRAPHNRLASEPRRFVAAGVIAGLLPLVHAHSLMVVGGVAACLAVLLGPWRHWLLFFAAAAAGAFPQLLWSSRHTVLNASSFIGWQFGWDHGTENVLWFWLKNTGLLIPLVVTAFSWRPSRKRITRRTLVVYGSFALWFVVANVIRLAPWTWDNIKVLVYWFIASAPLAAVVLAELWRRNNAARFAALAMLGSMTLAGSLDLWRVVSHAGDARVFDREGMTFAERLRQGTAPNALILHAPVQNHPVFLSGRRSFMGYPGHVWSHGLPTVPRENEIREIYAGSPQARAVLAHHGIDYVVIGPLERRVMKTDIDFFDRNFEAEQSGDYRLYRITSDAQ